MSRSNGVVTVAEAYERYPGEWVLLEIVQRHRDPMRVRGRLLAHSRDRRDLDEPFERLRSERPEAPTAEFFAGEAAVGDAVVIL